MTHVDLVRKTNAPPPPLVATSQKLAARSAQLAARCALRSRRPSRVLADLKPQYNKLHWSCEAL
jgi:hypothetical protein